MTIKIRTLIIDCPWYLSGNGGIENVHSNH